MYLKRNPTTGDFLGSIPEVASTIVALGSRGWLREAAQVVGVNRMLGKGEGIWGCFLFCRRFSPFWLGISVVKIAFGFFPVKSRRDAECKPHRWDPLKLMSKVIRTAWWSCFGGFDYVHRYIMNYIYIYIYGSHYSDCQDGCHILSYIFCMTLIWHGTTVGWW